VHTDPSSGFGGWERFAIALFIYTESSGSQNQISAGTSGQMLTHSVTNLLILVSPGTEKRCA